MPEPEAGTAVRRGQFRLTRLQVVNWGSFAGYRDLPVDERGVLFTGPSGAGKSQLLDAHSVALLPRTLQQFNASADLTARGSKQAARTMADYVRGRWSENDDEHGQAQPLYLRGGLHLDCGRRHLRRPARQDGHRRGRPLVHGHRD